ncbi:nitroreductase family protein [Clostridium sp. C8-1-8]|uniref:nitroreductase family protein n=1 Tax=Clostridium sp. C8-1-8 TaxID=2698831 RepID=UPI001367A1B2|nr:nitroreductase family protein [Clostridium sp. C8-1-8]
MIIDFYTAVKSRRSIYAISNESTIPDDRIVDILKDAVKYAPTSFNSQSGRVLLLLGNHHTKLWEITKEALRKIVPEASFSQTEEKLDSFAGGHGTILYFEDQDVIKSLQDKFSLYKDNFPVWSEQSSGILQYIVWTALEIEGLGASLQHYNPLIDEEVRSNWHIPESWMLIAQMPFGKPLQLAGEKEYQSIDERFRLFQ